MDQVPFPVVESVVKIDKKRWNFDWSIIPTRQTAALTAAVRHGQHGQVLLSRCQCQVPNTPCRDQDRAQMLPKPH